MKKWLLRIVAGLLSLILLVVLVAWLLVGTESGTRWLVAQVQGATDDALQVGSVQGTLLGKLSLRAISFATPDMQADVANLDLSWRPRALFEGVFHLQALNVADVSYRQLRVVEEAEADAASEPLQLADIELPITIRIDGVKVERVNAITAPAAKPVVVDEVLLALLWNQSGIDLQRLSLRMPELDLDANGTLNPVGQYPLKLSNKLAVKGEGLPQIRIDGGLNGDLSALRINQRLEGDVGAKIQVDLTDLLGKLGWELDLQLDSVSESLVPQIANSAMQAQLTGKGNLQQATVQLRAAAGEEQQNDLQLDARVDLQKLVFDASGQWQRLQWPLTGTPVAELAAGSLTAKGDPDDYRFEIKTGLSGPDIPPGAWHVSGNGNSQRLDQAFLRGELLEGTVDIKTKAAWAPAVSWQSDLVVSGINPGSFYPDWPGEINLRSEVEGGLENEVLKLRAVLESLDGNLNGQPLAGNGTVRIDGQKIWVDKLNVASGRARLDVDGQVAEILQMQWGLEVPDLAELLPGSAGTIKGSGSLAGTMEQPTINGELLASGVTVEANKLESVQAEFALSMDQAQPSRLDLQAKNIDLNGQLITDVVADLDGSIDAHTLALQVKHEQVTLDFAARGGYLQQDAAWEGEVERLAIANADHGDWDLQKAVPVYLSAAQTRVAPLCLVNAQASVCTEADWALEQGNAKLTLHGYDLSRLGPFLPPQVAELTGLVALDLQLVNRGAVEAVLDLNVAPGVIVLQADAQNQVRMQRQETLVSAKFDQQALVADWNLLVDAHSSSGELKIPRQQLEADPDTAPLSGKLQLLVQDLELVKTLVPEVEEIVGDIRADMTLGGTIGEPRITGDATAQASTLRVPRVGLDMTGLLVKVTSDGSETLRIAGNATAGGTLELDGKVALDAEQGFPLQVAVRGERFQALNLPDLQVLLNTDLQLERDASLTRVRGSLALPEANIQLNELPEGSQSASTDVIIAGQEAPPPPTANLDVNVELELGENVRFAGFGLTAFLQGRITTVVLPGRLPTANGDITIEKGSFRAYGQDLTIEEGRITYAGGYLDNPGIQLRASRRISDTTVGVDVAGTAQRPELRAFSDDPDMREADAISMMLTGQKSDNLQDAQIYAGKQITPKLSVGVNVGAGDTATEFVARYRLRKNMQLEGTSSSEKSGGSVLYTIDVE